MAVTASRLGSSPLTFDWTHLLSRYSPDPVQIGEAWSAVKQRFNSRDVGFYDSPVNPEISQAPESQALADALLKKNQFTDCLFLGIGGSALGPISLISSLAEKANTSIQFHFIENPDPLVWKHTLKDLRPDSTLVCAVTKSGTTFETIAQTMLALEWLGRPLWKTHFIAITDPASGDLRAFAHEEGIQTLSIHPSMGGRFSVFSPVGLFPAALSGFSVSNFLLGAKQVHDYIEKTPLEKNPIFILGSELVRQSSKRPIHVCMPYSSRLKSIGDWFVQLWAESLGKNGKGFTPLAAVGATDQHSILQLLRDGPDDKVTFFISVDKVEDEVKIPKAPFTLDRRVYPAFKLLEGHTLQELLEIEHRATSLVLTKQARPHFGILMDTLDERSMGALYYAFCVLTAYTGSLLEVNPFDQPGVEEGKVYIRRALGEPEVVPETNTAVERLRGNS